MKFTRDSVVTLSLPAGKSDHFEWDESLPGFGVRLRQGGSLTWVIQYRFGPQQRRESLGDVRKVTLEAAQAIARKRFAKVELSIDPAAERARQRAEAAASKLTIGTVADRYLAAKEDVLRQSTHKAAKRYFAVQWAPMANRPLDAVKRAEVAARLQEIIKAHGRTSAARARGHLSSMFSWAVREGLCEENPVINTNDPAEGLQPRERVLDDGEIRAIWKACRDDDFGRIVRLLLLTGCRRAEIGGLQWSEINFDAGVMKIPGTRTKNGQTLELTLPDAALNLLRSAPRRDGRAYVFGNRGGVFGAWSYSTVVLNNRLIAGEGRPLAPWTLHDLRRTVRTGMGKLGVAPHVAELVINHVKKGMVAVYDRYKYQPEIKAALALWADHVRTIVEGGERKIIQFPA